MKLRFQTTLEDALHAHVVKASRAFFAARQEARDAEHRAQYRAQLEARRSALRANADS